MKPVTIILPVYNGLRFVRPCLESLAAHTDPKDYRLILMDDCSDSHTAAFLREAAGRIEDCTLLRNDENLGFLRTCNRAWSHCGTPFVLLLNSDVLVTPDWIPRLLRCAESDPRIATVNPLTNHAANIDLPLPAGCNHLGLDRQIAARPPRCHDVVTGVGFCLLLRREAVGQRLFDEVYGMGYCEESDLCMRLTTSGWRTVSAENVFVHHRGHGTFADSNARYAHNRRLFDSRWDETYRAQYREFLRRDPLRAVRQDFAHPRQLWPRRYARQTIQQASTQIRHGQTGAAALTLLRAARHPGRALDTRVSPALVQRCARAEAPSVTYVVQDLSVSGGVLSIVQLVNELILRGLDARIAARSVDPGIRDWTWLLTEPMVFRSPSQLIREMPPTDVAVATIWTTAPWVRALGDAGRARVLAYFLQDYEPWFLPETDPRRQQIVDGYRLIPNRIVKSDWLAGKLAGHGYDSAKITLGMDLDQFYPRDRKAGPLTVLTMARPSTPWRGFSTAVEALAEVKRQLPETRVVFFGSDEIDAASIPFEFESAGRVTSQNILAQLYSDADVFLDASTFQGFGRCSLEAMSCGTAVVLTPVGGVTEYARPGENCLAVAPSAPGQTAVAVLGLLRDPALRQRLTAGGLETARRFCHRREADETARYFRALLSAAAAGRSSTASLSVPGLGAAGTA